MRPHSPSRARDLPEAAQDEPSGPLARLRAMSARTLAAADDVLGRALARQGRHTEALPLLEAAAARWVDDSGVLVDLLRTMAAIGGPAVALGRYEDYRSDLAERLGVDPAPELQHLHRELLAADDPVRTGLRYDGGLLLGRDDDLARLRSALASSRLVTVLGPGGIGKTSVAQALARESVLPHVRVVELVGVGAGDDVVAAVGAGLGVRGSVTTRAILTPAQQADVRSRIAAELDAGPTLLVLDNCEHVLEPVATLVAFLLATTRDLQVLATSRAPLRLAAERAVPLTQLSPADAGDLFERRATATRPDAVLDPAAVRQVVERLDGLPLAVELAAARIRTMTVAEVAAALEDRFAALRSRDRSTPDRHRTLEAVIAWSWDLLAPDEQRALAWLSVFQDGFDRATATSVLGLDGPDLVGVLVEQSLIVMGEDRGGARFRALETIREYAATRLAAAGEQDDASAAQRRWALELADRSQDLVVAARPGRAARRPGPRAEQPHRRAAARAVRRGPGGRRPAGVAARQPLDDHRGPAADLRGLRPGRRAAHRVGGPRRAGPPRPRGGGRADDPPQLDAERRPQRAARPAPAGRAARRCLGPDRAHRARGHRAGRRLRAARAGRRRAAARHGGGTADVGGDRGGEHR